MVAVIALNGCAVAATIRSYDVAPNGLEKSDQALRDLLARANGDRSTLSAHGKMPKDRLLKALYEGTIAYYGGDYNAAVKRFELAYQLTEDRYTKSLSRGVGSLLVNDKVMEYLPGENERLFIHYYAALAYLRKNEPGEAAVEARRLVYQLQRLDEKAGARDRQTRAMLRYFAGTVFEAAGETNDALVAYRNAALALGDTAGARRETLTADGNVVVIVEQGFVAHRVNQSLWIGLGRNEAQLFVTRDDDRYRRGAFGVATRVESSLAEREDAGLFVSEQPRAMQFDAPMSLDSVATEVADSLAAKDAGPDSVMREIPSRSVPTTVVSLPPVADATAVSRPQPARTNKGPDGWIREHILKGNEASKVMSETSSVEINDSRRKKGHRLDDDDRILRVSLPAFHRLRSTSLPTVTVGDSVVVGARVSASLSEAVVADYARSRNAVLARAVARAATRFVVHEAVEKKATDKWGKTTGDIVGFFTQAAGAALERADTRSWHLLPERITIVRMPKAMAEVRVSQESSIAHTSIVAPQKEAGFVSLRPARLWAQD